MTLAERVLASGTPFVFFHTWTVTEELLARAIREEKSMDLDIAVDDAGRPYLGHSPEYHAKSGEPYFRSLPLWDVVGRIVQSNIVTLIDCKHHDAWPVIEEIVAKIGPERCVVSSFVSELKFGHSRAPNESDFLTEWVPLAKLRDPKAKFPAVTANACAKWPPPDLLSLKYRKLVAFMRDLMQQYRVDTTCLSAPDETVTDEWLRYFRAAGIVPHIVIDRADTSKLSEVYIGEMDHLARASKSLFARP